MKNLFINSVTMLTLFTLIISCEKEKTDWSVKSPSENIQFNIVLSETSQLMYNVALIEQGVEKQVIVNSPLGIRRADESFIQNMKFVSMEPVITIDETFSLPIGKHKIVNNEVNELSLNFENENGTPLQLVIRAANDGVAFRYRFPNFDEQLYSVEEEVTGFMIAGEGKTWMAPYDKVTMYSPGYERYFENGIPIGTPRARRRRLVFACAFSNRKCMDVVNRSSARLHLFWNAPSTQCRWRKIYTSDA
jgi:alpha-glucosidase